MTNLLKQMKMDLELKGYSPKTIDAYLRYARRYLQYHQKPIEQLKSDEIRRYLHCLTITKKYSHICSAQSYPLNH